MPCHSVQDSSSSPGFAASLATARPSLTPRWNPASRSRAAAGDLFSTTACVPGTVPGTRFAFGSRWGSPAAVEPPEDGESTVSAACQPSSAGEDQRFSAAEVMPDEPGVMRPPLNQPDSTASKMGNRRVPAGPSADDTITPPSAEVVSWLKGAAIPGEALENCDILLSPGADKPGPEREAIPEVSPAIRTAASSPGSGASWPASSAVASDGPTPDGLTAKGDSAWETGCGPFPDDVGPRPWSASDIRRHRPIGASSRGGGKSVGRTVVARCPAVA